MPLNEIWQAQLQNTRLLNDLSKEHGETRGRLLTLEKHVDRIEDREHSKPQSGRPAQWTPRDWMMAGAGLSMVVAALTEKAGWTTVVSGLVKLYGGR